MATMLADQEVLRLFSALYNNDLQTVREIVQGGLDPKHVQFVIQTDEICMCSAAFENLGVDFLEESLPLSIGSAWPATSSSGQNNQSDSGCVSEKDQSEDGNAMPIFHWLESGMCGHVTIRNQSDDMIIYESDEFEYESDDDLDKELDLEVYGIKVTPQPPSGEYTPKSPAGGGNSPYSPHLHPPDVTCCLSVSPRNPCDVIRENPNDVTRDLTETLEKVTLSDGSDALVTREILSSAFRCVAPCPDDYPAYLANTDSPDVSASPRRRQSVAEILAAAQSETSGIVTISPLVSPLKISTSCFTGNCNPERHGTQSDYVGEQVEILGTQVGVFGDQVNLEEVYEADVKFAAITPMHVAASRGLNEVLEYLLNQGCDVNVKTMETEDSPLHLAARWGHSSTVQLLLNNGADVAISNGVKYSPLDAAIESGNASCVLVLLDHLAIMGGVTDELKRALLSHCIAQDRRPLVEEMINKFNFDVNERYFENGYTLLHKAALCGALSCLKLLLQMNVDIDVTTEEGETALFISSGNGHTSCLESLLCAGAKQIPAPNWLIGDNQTPLMIGCYNNNPDVVRALLPSVGDGINAVSEYGDTALHYAAARGNVDIVRQLISAGAAINVRNVYNATPLWSAVTKHDVILTLLQAGAATNVTSTGYSLDKTESQVYETPKLPLEVALLHGCFESVRILLKYGSRTFPGILDCLNEGEKQCKSADLFAEIKQYITDARRLQFLALCCVKETIAAKSTCSLDEFNDVIYKLPVITNDVKKVLLVTMGD